MIKVGVIKHFLSEHMNVYSLNLLWGITCEILLKWHSKSLRIYNYIIRKKHNNKNSYITYNFICFQIIYYKSLYIFTQVQTVHFFFVLNFLSSHLTWNINLKLHHIVRILIRKDMTIIWHRRKSIRIEVKKKWQNISCCSSSHSHHEVY